MTETDETARKALLASGWTAKELLAAQSMESPYSAEELLIRWPKPEEWRKYLELLADNNFEWIGESAVFTDTANAGRLAELHGSSIRYVALWKTWLVWERQRWVRDDGGVRVAELAKDVGRNLLRIASETRDRDRAEKLGKWGTNSLSAARIGAMVQLARGISGLMVEPDQLDRDPWLLGVQNGVVNLQTGELQEASPADLMSMQAPVEWADDAEAPRWEQAMREWFPDPAVCAYVQRLVGTALVGKQKEHLFVVHYGSGANGKGTFMRALFRMLGPYAVVPHMSLLLQTKHEQHSTVKASLYRTRLAVASEAQRRVRLNEASIKNLTGDDVISCRRLYENEWSFEPSHTLWLQTNYLPEISGRDFGMWRRIQVVPWVSTFRPTKSADDLDEVLAKEAPGILRWAVEGCLAWQREGLQKPLAVQRGTAAYRSEQDVFSRFAKETGLALGSEQQILSERLKLMYEEWAQSQGVKPQIKELVRWLTENNCERKQRRVALLGGKPKWHYVGIGEEAGEKWEGVGA